MGPKAPTPGADGLNIHEPGEDYVLIFTVTYNPLNLQSTEILESREHEDRQHGQHSPVCVLMRSGLVSCAGCLRTSMLNGTVSAFAQE